MALNWRVIAVGCSLALVATSCGGANADGDSPSGELPLAPNAEPALEVLTQISELGGESDEALKVSDAKLDLDCVVQSAQGATDLLSIRRNGTLRCGEVFGANSFYTLTIGGVGVDGITSAKGGSFEAIDGTESTEFDGGVLQTACGTGENLPASGACFSSWISGDLTVTHFDTETQTESSADFLRQNLAEILDWAASIDPTDLSYAG